MRIRRNILNHKGCRTQCGAFPKSQTSQQEPSLHDILVRYQNGLDISQFVTTTAVKASAEQQFANRVGKVDPLTEVPKYIKDVFKGVPQLDENGNPVENLVNDNEKKVDDVHTNVENEKSN